MTSHVLDMLNERESVLRARIDELRAQLAPAEAELEDIAVAKGAIVDAASKRVLQLPAHGASASAASLAYFNGKANNAPFQNHTMKQLVRKALIEEFPDGATARQLLNLFHHEYGRTDIIRSSLSPQLSRLRVEHVIWRDGLIWRLGSPLEQPTIFGADAPNENAPPADPSDRAEDGAEAQPVGEVEAPGWPVFNTPTH